MQKSHRKNKNSVARIHHYLPQSYLASFTDTGKKSGKFFVLDVNSGSSFPALPRRVAAERDFNRIDTKGESPDAVEQAFAQFEDKTVQAVRDTLTRKTFPEIENLIRILNLICLIAVRNPYMRKSFNRAKEKVRQQIVRILVSDKRIWDSHIQANKLGNEYKDISYFLEWKRIAEEDRIQFLNSPQENLVAEINAFDELLPEFLKRKWSLFVIPEGSLELICSDHPVTLCWKNQIQKPVGYSLKETEVFFPLGRKAGFYGTFEDALPPVVELKHYDIARLNNLVYSNAERHVYSALQTFVTMEDNRICRIAL